MKYFEKVKKLSKIYNFDTEYITADILNVKNGVCFYNKCKCHKQKKTNFIK